MHRRIRLNSSILVASAFAFCCGGTGCVFEGGHALRRVWIDYNTLATPAIFLEEIHHLPLRSSRTDQLRWMYNQGPTLTYDEDGLKAYREKQAGKSWMLMARQHFTGKDEFETKLRDSFPQPAPGVESQHSNDSQKFRPGFVPPAPEPLGESNKKNDLKKTKTPTLKSPPETDEKKSTRGPVALRLPR